MRMPCRVRAEVNPHNICALKCGKIEDTLSSQLSCLSHAIDHETIIAQATIIHCRER
jgi:hypothetical protein